MPRSSPAGVAHRQQAPDLAAAGKAAAGIPRLHSLLVSRQGKLILEHYATPRRSGLSNVKSVSKSIISALVGIAIERQLIKDVKQPIADYFPQLRSDPDPRKLRITVEDLLTMQPGLESTSFDGYGAWVGSRNWVNYVLERPMVADPGTTVEYSTGNTHLLSAILTKATKRSTRQFAQQVLAAPLGITLAEWARDPQGIYFGGNEMMLTPRQMVAIGELYLNRGRAQGPPGRPRGLGRSVRAGAAGDRGSIPISSTATAGGSVTSAAPRRALRGDTAASTSWCFPSSSSSS